MDGCKRQRARPTPRPHGDSDGDGMPAAWGTARKPANDRGRWGWGVGSSGGSVGALMLTLSEAGTFRGPQQL